MEAADAAATQAQTAESLENASLEAAIERAEDSEAIERTEDSEAIERTKAITATEALQAVDLINAALARESSKTAEAADLSNAAAATESSKAAEAADSSGKTEAVEAMEAMEAVEAAEAADDIEMIEALEMAEAGNTAAGNASNPLHTSEAAEALDARAVIEDMEATGCGVTHASAARTAQTTPTNKPDTINLSTIKLKRELAKELSGAAASVSDTLSTLAEATHTEPTRDTLRAVPLSASAPAGHAPESVHRPGPSGNKHKAAALPASVSKTGRSAATTSLRTSVSTTGLPALSASLPLSVSNTGLCPRGAALPLSGSKIGPPLRGTASPPSTTGLLAGDSALARRAAAALRVCNAQGQQACFIDLGVYTRNRNFRLYLSSKLERQAWLRVAPDCDVQIAGDTAEARARCVFEKATVAQVASARVLAALTLFGPNCNGQTTAGECGRQAIRLCGGKHRSSPRYGSGKTATTKRCGR